MKRSEVTQIEDGDAVENFEKRLLNSKGKHNHYRYIGEFFEQKYSKKTSMNLQIFYEIFTSILISIQATSFCWNQTMPISN